MAYQEDSSGELTSLRSLGRFLPVLLLFVPLGSGLIATALFFSQGGFGGSYGDTDLTIILLGLPSIIFLNPSLATLERGEFGDLVTPIWFPALFNLLTLWLPLAIYISPAMFRPRDPSRL